MELREAHKVTTDFSVLLETLLSVDDVHYFAFFGHLDSILVHECSLDGTLIPVQASVKHRVARPLVNNLRVTLSRINAIDNALELLLAKVHLLIFRIVL